MSTPPTQPDHRRSRRLPALGRLARRTACALALGAALAAHAAPPRDTLVLLIPDNASATSWPVKVWTDTAADEGLRLRTMTDSQFLALGAGAAAQIAGLIMPDSAHVRASDAVVAAVKQYANLGGRVMLVYDAGALTDTGYYAPTRSRFSDLVGVDYTLYDTLLDRTVGFGPVVGTASTLDGISLPPGKSVPWSAPVTATAGTTATYVGTSTADPGGTLAMQSYTLALTPTRIDESSTTLRQQQNRTVRSLLGIDVAPTTSSVTIKSKVGNTTRVAPSSISTTTTTSSGTTVMAAAALAAEPLRAISGYGYGQLGYFSYVTRGTFSGTTYLTSPDHGLVAGSRTVGSGSVLFVNLPLGYFKAIGSDSALMHGMLGLFARDLVQAPRMSVQPKGVGGLVYNWHVDDGDDLTADVKYLLDSTTVLRRGPFSIHFTAGPDTVTLGDAMGMSLDTSTASQTQFKRIKSLAIGHELASHGGWNHDLYGLNVSETNQATYQPWLELNFAAVERQYGKRTTEYSAPQGNNPTWAVNWLENRGVIGMYFVGDTGSGAVRSWRAGQRLTRSMWSFPLTPLEKYGTFEEFEEFGVTDAVSGKWLTDLQSFVVAKRTNRMFYNHPPGARGHLAALDGVLTNGDRLKAQGKFNWYTMTQLARFGDQRLAVTWGVTRNLGVSTFDASHATSLADMTWLIPRAAYATPRVTAGSATVDSTSDPLNHLVIAKGGRTLRFTAVER